MARFEGMLKDAPVFVFIKDLDGGYVFVNGHYLAELGGRLGDDWYGKTDADIWPEAAAEIQANDAQVLAGGTTQLFHQVMPFPDGPHHLLVMKFPLMSDDGDRYLAGIGIDDAGLAEAEETKRRLAVLVDQVAESVVVTDVEGSIIYVNPAFERATGYAADEVVGRNPRILGSGAQSHGFYSAMWTTIAGGLPWVGEFVNRRKDGSTFTEEAVITPLKDRSGSVTGYVAVKRDVTAERAMEEQSARLVREQRIIGATLKAILPRQSVAAAAKAVCEQLLTLEGAVAAHIFAFEIDGRAKALGSVAIGASDVPLARLSHRRSRELRVRGAEGPWIEPWISRPTHPYNLLRVGLGVHFVAFVPIRWADRQIGLLVIDFARTVDLTVATGALPALLEFADLTGIVIGQRVAEGADSGRALRKLQAIIERRTFHPVFQPIIDLTSLQTVGHEALTRFDDRVAPDVRFGAAAALGVGIDLEIATLTAAIATASESPWIGWLSVNVSPSLIADTGRLASILLPAQRHLVIEVTEHVEIEDYGAFRESVVRLGPDVQLAVDDAGAGFASLRHILEVHPAYVKLDRSLIANLERDEARQALIVGLAHFCRSTGSRLIAEGIETVEELAVTRTLPIDLGQGYLLGRPARLRRS